MISIGRTVGVRGLGVAVRRGVVVVVGAVRLGEVVVARFGWAVVGRLVVVCRFGWVVVARCVVDGRVEEADGVVDGRVVDGRVVDGVVVAGRVTVAGVVAGVEVTAVVVVGRVPPGRRTPAESIIWLRTAVRNGPSVPMFWAFRVSCNPPAFPSDTLKVFIARHVFTTPLSSVPVELRWPSETTSNHTRAVARPTNVMLSPGCHDDSETGVAGESGELMICAGESALLDPDGWIVASGVALLPPNNPPFHAR